MELHLREIAFILKAKKWYQVQECPPKPDSGFFCSSIGKIGGSL